MSNEVPNIVPIKLTEFKSKQSKYKMVGNLPTRSVICGPSGSGKGILLQNMILDIYRDCFSRIYIFSPSISVDHTWKPVKEYIEKNMKLKETDEEQFYFNEYDAEALEEIINTQHKITKYMKNQGHTKLYQILIIVDDFADNPDFARSSKLLHQLFIRGRHNMISTIVSTQKFNAISPIIRVNMTELFVFRLRNAKDLEAFLEEISAVADKKTLMAIYNLATKEEYSFLYCKLNSKTVQNMFFIKFGKRIEIETEIEN
jgi:hypothetical protein